MSFSIQAKYFWIAIVIVGSMGIWLPFILASLLDKELDINTIPINMTTYYVSIYFAGSIDLILKYIDDEDRAYSKTRVLNMIGLILLSIFLIISTIWMNVSGMFTLPLILSIIGVGIALYLWWISNKQNQSFNEVIRSEANSKHGKNW